MTIDPDDLEEMAESQPGDPNRHFLIYCDESGIDAGTVFGFGSLWMPWERRGDFLQLWRRLQQSHFPPSEAKWTKVKSQTLPFFEALVDEFFQRNWLMFHCLLIGKPQVDLSYHQNSWDLARRKHFVMLLTNKIKRFAAPGKQYRIRVDPLPSSYAKADEAAEIILRRMLNEDVHLRGMNVIHSLRTVDSKATPGVQLSDVLLGAIVSARRGQATSAAKHSLIKRIAGHLDWPDLLADTMPAVRKFNIWRFWHPTSGERRPEATRRHTSLL